MLLSLALMLPTLSLGWVLSLQFVIQLFEGIYHPFRYRMIRDWIPDESERGSFIAGLQSVDGTAAVLGPALAGVCLQLFSTRWCLVIDAATYLFSF